MDEGYIKFNAQWERMPLPDSIQLEEIKSCRQALYQKKWIGVYPNGVGYGNISQRLNKSGSFIITGSRTGALEKLTNAHFSVVRDFSLAQNTLYCEGPSIASSESMSHAVFYQECPWVNGVIHIHHQGLWERLLGVVPTTAKGVAYGTPEMAWSIIDLLKHSSLKTQQILVMHGHPEGIFVFGEQLSAAQQILELHFNAQ